MSKPNSLIFLLVSYAGDTLEKRCDHASIGSDPSINCHSVTEFIAFVKDEQSKRLNRNDYIHYIATNEHDPDADKRLQEAGFKTMSALRPLAFNGSKEVAPSMKLYPTGKLPFNSLTAFVIELMLMCDADYFFGWGVTSTHTYVQNCRAAKKGTTFVKIKRS